MALKIAILGSGSKGNCSLISDGRTNILLDAGLSPTVIVKRLSEFGLDVGDLDGLLLTHEHDDHVKAVEVLAPFTHVYSHPDTLAAVREAMRKGAIVTALCNVVGSTIARESGRGIYLHAGPEMSVASTKGFTTQVAVLLLFALLLGRNRRLSRSEGIELVKQIQAVPDLVRSVLDQAPACSTSSGSPPWGRSRPSSWGRCRRRFWCP